MNYPEELRERWNECQFDDRDIIQKFLEKQYDLRYGRQRGSWHLEPAVMLMNIHGNGVSVTDIRLDKNKLVTFEGVFCSERSEFECSDFAYGELSKVIEALPNADDIVWNNALTDLNKQSKNLRIDLLLAEHPLVYESSNGTARIDGRDIIQDYNFAVLGEKYGLDFLVKLRDHINIEALHASKEYKKLMELLSLQENLRFECNNFGDAEFVIDGADITIDVSALQRDDKGNLVIYGADLDADEDFEFTEKDIKHQYLTSIIECMKPKYSDIMDTYNAHNPELVRKINDAWKNDKYHDKFGDILFALGCRDNDEIFEKFNIIIDYKEAAMDNAHAIMEGVCDDQDLECILNFIRYED